MSQRNKILTIVLFSLLFVGIIALFRKKKPKTMPTEGLKYFNLSEFDSPDEPGSGFKMQWSTLLMLDKAREIAGVPFKINSGYRTKAHNTKVKGAKTSSHMIGMAADIAVSDATRNTVLKALYQAGFRRFGVGKNFVHADNDSSKSQNVVWGYPTTNWTIEQIAAL